MNNQAANLFGWVDGSASYPQHPGHKGDLDTGREAARRIAPMVKGIRRKVLDSYLKTWPGGMTADQAASDIRLSILTVRPRCAELRRMGLLEATDRRKANESGHTATVLRATREAVEAAHG